MIERTPDHGGSQAQWEGARVEPRGPHGRVKSADRAADSLQPDVQPRRHAEPRPRRSREVPDARRAARVIAEREGSYLVEDSLDVLTCDGAGTIGLELFERPEELDAVVIALGGGAMASGIGCVAKSLAPHVEVLAVQPAGAPAMALSWRRGSIVESETIETIADGVAGRFPIPEVLGDLLAVVDDVVLVGEESIKAGMRLLYRHAGLIVEPSAALGVAAVLEDRDRFSGRRIATVICGSNVMTNDFERWVLAPDSGRRR